MGIVQERLERLGPMSAPETLISELRELQDTFPSDYYRAKIRVAMRWAEGSLQCGILIRPKSASGQGAERPKGSQKSRDDSSGGAATKLARARDISPPR
jgi:hypothetical protein